MVGDNFAGFANFEMARALKEAEAKGVNVEFYRPKDAGLERTAPRLDMQYRAVPQYVDEKGIPISSPPHGVHSIPSFLSYLYSAIGPENSRFHEWMLIEEPRSLHWPGGIL